MRITAIITRVILLLFILHRLYVKTVCHVEEKQVSDHNFSV